EIERSPFVIPTDSHEWPANKGAVPRRAGVNGFGFGGTNAHVIVEEFSEPFHRALCQTPFPQVEAPRLSLVAAGTLFPSAEVLAGEHPSGRQRFQRAQRRLPRKKLVLPDVADDMDITQFLVPLAAEQIFDRLPGGGASIREQIGVVLGLEGKTERGFNINK